jgi:putative transposase
LAIDRQTRRRLERYRGFIAEHVDKALIADIRQATNRGMAIGSEEFKQQIEAVTGRRMRPANMGRPKVKSVHIDIKKFTLDPS